MDKIGQKENHRPISWTSLLTVLLAGFLLRLVLLVWFFGVTPLVSDEKDYIYLGTWLTKTGDYRTECEAHFSLRPPIYPAMLAEIYHAAGMESHQTVRMIQIIISLATACVVYFTARSLPEILSEKGAIYATAFFCFYPSLVGMNFLILTETLFTFFVAMIVFCGVKFFRTGAITAACFLGVFIALGALTRSVLWLSPFPLAIFILLFATSFSWKRRLTAAGCLLLFAGIIIAPWAIRNTKVEGTLTIVDCMGGRNLMMGNYEHTPLSNAWAAIEVPPPNDWYTVMQKAHLAETGVCIDGVSPGVKDKLAMKYAVRYILAHPGQTAVRNAMKACCFWQLERSFPGGAVRGMFGFERFGEWKSVAALGLAAVILPVFIFITISMIFAVFSWNTERFSPENKKTLRTIFWFFLCVILYFWVLHAIIFAHERYRLPILPIFCILAAMFWDDPKRNLDVLISWRRRWMPACGLVLGMGIFWCTEVSWVVKYFG